MTTITLAAAAAVTPETMVGANGAMATMGGKDLELRGGLDSSPGPSTYSLRDPRPSTSSSLSFLIHTMGTISPPPRCCWDENNACHFLGTEPGTRCPVATPKEGDNGTRDEGTVVVEILPRSRRRVGS